MTTTTTQSPRAKSSGSRNAIPTITRGLDWEPSYQPREKIFPYTDYEGIRIHDWDKFEDPFRLTMDAYWKFQAEKERRSMP
jgi:phenol hydroxylase P3 protein